MLTARLRACVRACVQASVREAGLSFPEADILDAHLDTAQQVASLLGERFLTEG